MLMAQWNVRDREFHPENIADEKKTTKKTMTTDDYERMAFSEVADDVRIP